MDSQKYITYGPIDFALDTSFIRWVRIAENHAFWQNWILEHPEKTDSIKTARLLVLSVSDLEILGSQSEVEKAWLKVHYRIQLMDMASQAEETHLEAEPVRMRPLYAQFMKVAAVILLLATFTFSMIYFKNELPNPTAYQTITTQKGEKLKFTLSDSTIVHLNAASTLKYPVKFDTDSREVILIGEAFFQVKSNPSKPFHIISNNIRTKVLGTSFNIQAYPEDGNVQIAVAEGHVNVETISSDTMDYHSVYLTKNEMVSFDKSRQKLSVSKFNETAQTGWKDNILYLEKADFKTVIKTLERWYDVKVILQNHPDDSWRFSGSFQKQSLDYILHTISYPNQFAYSIQEKTVTIY